MRYDIKARYVDLPQAKVDAAKYADGSVALIARGEYDDGEPFNEVLTVNLTGYNMTPPAGHVFVRDYSEHEGLPDALEKLGILRKAGTSSIGPFDAKVALMKVEVPL